jgi:transposase-like protein
VTEEDLLAFYAFPADRRPKLRSTNPLARVNAKSVAAPTSSASSPTTAPLIRLAASVVIEQNDEWLVGRRYLSNHSLEAILESEKEETTNQEAREPTPV